MKRRGCFVLLGMCSALFFTNGIYSDASGINEDEGKWVAFEANQEYRIQFREGVGMFSQSGENNIEVLDDIIKMVQCKIQTGSQEFTVGVEFADNGYTDEGLKQGLDNAIKGIEEEERLPEGGLCLDELMLDSIYIENIKDGITPYLADVEQRYLREVEGVGLIGREEQGGFQTQSAPMAATGSFHYVSSGAIGSSGLICWYNQKAGSVTICDVSPTSPHLGDGNVRYNFGYRWFPKTVRAEFFQYNLQGPQSKMELYYTFDEESLRNLNIDDNEALEMEIVLYNYANASSVSERGSSFMPVLGEKEYRYYYSNIPNAYIDTSFADSKEELSFCVGCEDASDYSANVEYYWGVAGSGMGMRTDGPNDGRFRVVAQRSYRTLLSSVPGTSTAFGVFAEEHEPIRALGLNAELNWVKDSAYKYLGTSGWTFDAGKNPVK